MRPSRTDRSLPRRASARWAAALLSLVLATALAPGCGTISAFIELTTELEDAGYRNPSVNVSSGGSTEGILTISAGAPPGEDTTEARDRAAEIAWDTFPRRVDAIEVTIDGDGRLYSRTELQEAFGPRPSGLDDRSLEDDITRIGVGALVALAAGGVLCVGGVIVIVLLVRRSNRKARERQAAYWAQQQGWGAPGQWPGPPPGAPPQPPGQTPPGWG